MLWYLLAGAMAALFTATLNLLPGPTFLALPAAAYDGLEAVAGWAGWFLGILGNDVKAAIVQTTVLIFGIEAFLLAWTAIKNWSPPILGRLIRGRG